MQHWTRPRSWSYNNTGVEDTLPGLTYLIFCCNMLMALTAWSSWFILSGFNNAGCWVWYSGVGNDFLVPLVAFLGLPGLVDTVRVLFEHHSVPYYRCRPGASPHGRSLLCFHMGTSSRIICHHLKMFPGSWQWLSPQIPTASLHFNRPSPC